MKNIKQWFITHGQSADPTAEDSSVRHWLNVEIAKAIEYDPAYGDDRECLCGHPYYRHFDYYDNMYPIGCKYCFHWSDFAEEQHCDEVCTGFKEKFDK